MKKLFFIAFFIVLFIKTGLSQTVMIYANNLLNSNYSSAETYLIENGFDLSLSAFSSDNTKIIGMKGTNQTDALMITVETYSTGDKPVKQITFVCSPLYGKSLEEKLKNSGYTLYGKRQYSENKWTFIEHSLQKQTEEYNYTVILTSSTETSDVITSAVFSINPIK
jgi:hypothetical protein